MSGVSGRFCGRFCGRAILGFVDGANLYSNYFNICNYDPFGGEEVGTYTYGHNIWGYYYRNRSIYQDWKPNQKIITFPANEGVVVVVNRGRMP